MFKKLIFAAFAMFISASAFALGPSQIWRLEITRSEGTIVEVAEIQLFEQVGGASVVDLLRSTTEFQTTAQTIWTIEHNLNVREDTVQVFVQAVNSALDPIEPTDTTIVDGDTVQLTFDENATGAVSIIGVSFDTPAANRPGTAVPVIVGLENRPAAAAWDGNSGSVFKSKKAPSEKRPLAIQYTYWIGDAPDPGNPDPAKEVGRHPNVVEYAITARKQDTAPRAWKLLYWLDGQWKLADQQAAQRFEDGQTRRFLANGN